MHDFDDGDVEMMVEIRDLVLNVGSVAYVDCNLDLNMMVANFATWVVLLVVATWVGVLLGMA